MSRFARLGRRIAALQDRKLTAMQRNDPRPSLALGEHLLRRAHERRRQRRVSVAAVLAVAMVAGSLAAVSWMRKHDQVVLATVRAEAGQRVTASLLDIAMSFGDGSQVVLSSGSSVRTEMVGPTSASLELERGRALVHVMHTKSTHWTVHAGTYTIAVTGTRFRVDWQPEKGAFSVGVEEGSVRVSGGLIAEPLDISAGQSFALEQGGTASALVGKPGVPAPPADSVPEMPPPPSLIPSSDTDVPVQARRSVFRRSAAPSWRIEAEAGHYREAMEEAERRGFDGICRDASGADLLTLAEAARYAGRADRAEQALKAVRTRFSRGEDASMAAYLLGRIAAESRRDHSDAAHWFRTYLAERPGGRLSREAEGRLLESLAFMDRSTAREAARVYLDHYPSGPHAAFARNLLGL
jgi:hypothetical protein